MHDISWWRTSFGDEEIKRIAHAIAHEHINQGAVTAEFERQLAELLGVPYVVATTSGSTALLMALLAVGIGPGDEVIVPNRTWIATAHAAKLLGATIVLADVDKDLPLLDVSQWEQKITTRTRAIIPAHLNGRAVAMDAVRRIAARHQVYVIEDAAQALCSRNARGVLGTQSDAGCFSLSVAKIISTGQGGFVVTRNEATYERLTLLRSHGVRDVIDVSYTGMGFNFRFTDIQASIGLAQLERLPERIVKVKVIYEKYASGISDLRRLRLIPVDVAAEEIPIYVEVLCPQREELVRFLADRGIQTRPFYPDLNQAGYLDNSGRFPNSELFGAQGLFLPCGPEQPLENVDRVLTALREFEKRQ